MSLLFTLGASAQGQLLNETFDSTAGFTITDGNGATATFFSDGAGDYFGIFDGDGDGGADFGAGTTPTGTESYTGFSDNYLVNEDMDGDGTVIPYTLTWSGIALNGETNLQISADFASTRADADDYIIVSYRVDAGAWVEILGVAGASGFNGPVYEITDFETRNGDASATAITIAFTNVNSVFALTGTETTLDIKAEFSNNNGDDNFGMDNLIVEALTGLQPPTALSASSVAAPNNKGSLSVNFTPDASNEVLIVYNTEDSFGAPVDAATYSANDPLPGGGTVAGVFSSSPATISGLAPGTNYYFAAFTVDGSNNYSDASPSFTGTTDTFAFQETGFGNWSTLSVASDNDWTVTSTSASISGFGGDAPAEDWLISPELDLDSTTDETFEFTYSDGFSDIITGLEVFYTDNYTGDPTTTIWTPFTAVNTELTDYTASGSGSVETAVDLSAISGSSTYLAFKYTSSGTGGGQTRNWDLQDPLISGNLVADPAITLSAAPATVAEGAGLTVNLSLPTTVGSDTVFFLSSNDADASEISFPASVTVLSGTDNVDFPVNGLNDGLFDNDQTVTLLANQSGYTLGMLDITVTDIDTPVASGDLIFTQYYEGAGNNKYLEVTNVGDNPIDLTGYMIVRWGNALAEEYKTATEGAANDYDELDLSSIGSLAAGQTIILANADATTPISAGDAALSEGFPGPFTFNGNDSVVIYNTSTPNPTAIVDVIGFTDAGNEGENTSFVRAVAAVGYDLTAGSNVTSPQFGAIWTEVATSTVDAATLGDDAFLGSTALATPPTIVSFTTSSLSVAEADGSFDLSVDIVGLTSGIVVVDINFNSGNSTADGSDITFSSPQQLTFDASSLVSPQTITVPIVDDGLDGSTEVASFDLSVSSGTAILGSPSTQDISIQDSDVVIPDVFISEVADPNDNANARFVELYNPSGAPVDLSSGDWHLVRIIQTGTIQAVGLTGTITANDTYVVASNGTVFLTAYGEDADQSNGNISGNGDDTYALYFGGDNTTGTLVDIYGVVGVDGTGEVWEYEDGRAVRDPAITEPNATFTPSEWLIFSDDPANANGIANVADMTPGIHPDPTVLAPTGVTATTVSDTQIEVAFTPTDSKDVVVIFNTSGSFTTPSGTPPAVGQPFAGGTVLYQGQSSPVSHTGLTSETQYFYLVYSVDGADYSLARTANATTDPAPIVGLINAEDFNDAGGDPDDWFNESISGNDPWVLNGSIAFADGFANPTVVAENHYLISPELDFTSQQDLVISFDYGGGFDVAGLTNIELLYSLDYAGDASTATWNTISFDFTNIVADGSYITAPSGEISLPLGVEGESSVRLAFRYTADGTELGSELWVVDNIVVRTTSAADPLGDYLTLRTLTQADLETDTNGNGFTVIEEYLAGFGDGVGPDALEYRIDLDPDLALTLINDRAERPLDIIVELMATSDLNVAFAPVDFFYATEDNGDGTYTHSYIEATPPAPAGDTRFLRLRITEGTAVENF